MARKRVVKCTPTLSQLYMFGRDMASVSICGEEEEEEEEEEANIVCACVIGVGGSRWQRRRSTDRTQPLAPLSLSICMVCVLCVKPKPAVGWLAGWLCAVTAAAAADRRLVRDSTKFHLVGINISFCKIKEAPRYSLFVIERMEEIECLFALFSN